MVIKNEFQPQFSIHPGRILFEEIKSRHMSQVEFAERVGLTAKHLSDIINGKADITSEVAISLEAAMGTPSHMWTTMQMNYDETLARQKEKASLERDLEVVSLFPYHEIQKVWPDLPNTRKPVERVIALRKFFCVSSLVRFIENLDNRRFTISTSAFRTISTAGVDKIDRFALASWVQIGKLQAARMITEGEYDKRKLQNLACQIPQISAMDEISEAWYQIRNSLLECGVKIVLAPYLSRTYVSGAVYWEDDIPVIVLNIKSPYWDSFIFTLLHETGHILLHGKSYASLSLDPKYTQHTDNLAEEEADKFAEDTIISPDTLKVFMDIYHGEALSIREFARTNKVDAGLIATLLLKEKSISASCARQFRRPIRMDLL